jgi:N-acetylmuramoyl-L-alanine amidase-like protein
VKLLASGAAAVCVLALAVVAAPALSTSRYRPKPLDFELAPSSRAILGKPARSGGFVSTQIRTARRFNLVGLRWRGRAEPRIAIRTRRNGGRWTHWETLFAHAEDGPDPGSVEPQVHGMSMPAWVGEADQVQYRMSRRVPGLRLHFVNVRGTATAADRAKTALRRVANSAVASVAGVLRADDADAQPAQPGMVSRKAWGADSCRPRTDPDYGVVKAAFIHHTVNSNDYTREEAPDIVLAICRFHRNSNGWNDIGYNFLVDKYGTLYEGRAGGIDQPVVGAQAQGYNAQSTGIANLGDYRSVSQSPAALDAIARLIRWKLPLHGVPTYGSTTLTSAGGSTNRFAAGRHVRLARVIGHRDTGATTCPGDALYAQLPELRRLVGRVDPAGGGSVLGARLSRRTVSYKGRVRIRGRLVALSGAPLAGRLLHVQVRRGGRWRGAGDATTDERGGYSVLLRPRLNRLLRVRFLGGGGLLPVTSPRVLVRVRSRVNLNVAPQSGVRGVRVRIRGTVTPRKGFVYQVLQKRRGGRFKTVGVKPLSVRRGRFRGSFTPEAGGTYRYYVVARSDGSTARGRSRLEPLNVGR